MITMPGWDAVWLGRNLKSNRHMTIYKIPHQHASTCHKPQLRIRHGVDEKKKSGQRKSSEEFPSHRMDARMTGMSPGNTGDTFIHKQTTHCTLIFIVSSMTVWQYGTTTGLHCQQGNIIRLTNIDWRSKSLPSFITGLFLSVTDLFRDIKNNRTHSVLTEPSTFWLKLLFLNRPSYRCNLNWLCLWY